jgi:MFS family permease
MEAMGLREFFRNRWWMVAASVIGLTVNTGVISVFLFGVFIKPVTEDLGLSRGALSTALVIGSVFTAFVTPLFGKAIDHFGIKVVHLPMIAAYAVATAMLALMPPSLPIVVALYCLHNITGAGQSPVAYSKTIAGWFDKERGLALGIAIAGVGLGVIIIPQFAGYMIVHYGWREAYVAVGIAIFVLAFIPVAIFMRDPPSTRSGRRAGGPATEATLDGVTWSEAVFGSANARPWRFWAMTLAFFFVVVAINGTLGTIVAVLTDRGLSLQIALHALSASGAALFAGRILSGYLLDRFHGPYVAIMFFCAAIVGIGLLASGGTGMTPFAATMLSGLGIGAEVDLMAFFVSRYFGLKAFGAIYGTMFALFGLGNGVGPFLMGISFDHWHGYVPMLLIFDAALAVACLLLLGLGPYRFAARSTTRAVAA